MRKDRAVNYVHDEIGTAKVNAGVSKAVCGFMSIPDGIDYELNDTGWAEEINEDYNRRGKKVRR